MRENFIKINKKILKKCSDLKDIFINFKSISIQIFIMKLIILFNPKMYNYKHRVIDNYLREFMSDFIKNYKFKKNFWEIDKIMWTMWWQGYENMPEIVKIAHESKKKIAKKYGYKFILIDKFNYKDFIEINERILNLFINDKISITFLSDIIRLCLLEKYGGVWIDSTVYLTEKFDMNLLENRDFFTIKHGGINDKHSSHSIARFRWTSFFIAASKDNTNISFMKNFLIDYIIKTEFCFEYFLLDYVFNLCYELNNDFKETIDNIPQITSYKNLFFLDFYKDLEYDDNLIKAKNLTIIKTTYKFNENQIKTNTIIFEYLKRKGFH